MESQELQSKVERLEEKLNIISSSIKEILDLVSDNFSNIETKLDSIDRRITNLHGDTDQNFEVVKLELKKINQVTSYSGMFDNIPKKDEKPN